MKANKWIWLLLAVVAICLILMACSKQTQGVLLVENLLGSWSLSEVRVDGKATDLDDVAYRLPFPLESFGLSSNMTISYNHGGAAWQLSDGKLCVFGTASRIDCTVTYLSEDKLVLSYHAVLDQTLQEIRMEYDRMGISQNDAPETYASFLPDLKDIDDAEDILEGGCWRGGNNYSGSALFFQSSGIAQNVEYTAGYWQDAGADWSWEVSGHRLILEYMEKEGEVEYLEILAVGNNIIVCKDDRGDILSLYRYDDYGRAWETAD